MTLNLSIEQSQPELRPHILVIGVGGAGCNAVNNMIRSELGGVDFMVCNTDAQSLASTLCDTAIQIGPNITQGLGAGAQPEIGRAAAEEDLDTILSHLSETHMVFITAGMGGGTGTGAAPVLARAIRERGILTVGVVTKPFHFEGQQRMRLAEQGIEELQHYVDTLIVIPNQNLFRVANEKTTFADAFNMADEVLHCGVRGVTDLMVMPGLINLDFADIRTVMGEMGKAMMGTGEADGEKRAVDAAEAAISNPLLDDVSMKGARGVLINISGGGDMTLYEVDEACNRIREEVDPDANIIFGATFDDTLQGRMRVSVVSTGIDAADNVMPQPRVLSLATQNGRPVPGEEIDDSADEPEEVATTAEDDFAADIASALDNALGQSGGAAPSPAAAPAMGRAATMAAPAAAPATAPGNTRVPLRASAPGGMAPHGMAPTSGRPMTTAPISTAATAEVLPEPEMQPELAAKGAEDAFIAPRPAEPATRRPAMAAPAPADAGDKAKAKSRGPSLFERMTGTGRARGGNEAAEDQAPAAAQPAPQPAPQEPRMAAPRPAAPAPAPAPAPAEPARPAGQNAQSAQDELLDIPAFLRRQAN